MRLNGTTPNGGFNFGVGTLIGLFSSSNLLLHMPTTAIMGMKGMIVANMPFTSILGCTDPKLLTIIRKHR